MSSNSEILRRLPAVGELLRADSLSPLIAEYGRSSVIEAVRAELLELRMKLTNGTLEEAGLDNELAMLPELLATRILCTGAPSLRRVINASGVIIHTNLGRAPLSADAVAGIARSAAGYSNLEFDLEKGERGQRDKHAEALFTRLFTRERIRGKSILVVNNNAAAVLLAVSVLASEGEVIISRGELVEIGGSFRIPDIVAQSGALLREVGTTNRTRSEDYKNAICDRTRLLLRIHRSNFEIVGFTEQPSMAELVELARQHNLPLMEDLGSGALIDLEAYGISGEPSVYASLRSGVSLVTFSGDKLLGGPQAGIAAGDPTILERMHKHPLFRALRVDKICYAALEATLDAYLREQYDKIPLLHMLRVPAEEVRRRCEALALTITGPSVLSVNVQPARTLIGGGAAPGKSLPSFALELAGGGLSASELALRLRQQSTPIVARVERDRVLLDLRTVDPTDDYYLQETLAGWPSSNPSQ